VSPAVSSGKRVAVLGAAFKPDSHDIRRLPRTGRRPGFPHRRGSRHRPRPEGHGGSQASPSELGYADSVEEACIDADVMLHLTEWKHFRDIDPAKLAVVLANALVVDDRNALDAVALGSAGWAYLGQPACSSHGLAPMSVPQLPKRLRTAMRARFLFRPAGRVRLRHDQTVRLRG
jgi:UDPglucose 6-dehydrogenase